MKKMLINASQYEELRVAFVDGEKLYDLYIEPIGSEQKKSNIYKGKVTRVEPSLGAAFINYGGDRHGFLPLKEVAKNCYQTKAAGEQDPDKIDIKDVLRDGQELMVQVEKEERGNKGAALTTFISMSGSYLVLMLNNPKAGGISRRIEGQEREELRTVLSQLKIPENMGVIVRTAGVGKTIEELQWDLDTLLHHWQAIKDACAERAAPFLIHKESDAIIRVIRDHLHQDVMQIIVDSPEVYEQIKDYIQQTKPDFVDRVELYKNRIPLFSSYRLEKQIETAYQRTVNLISGGSIVIDHTEALVSIDVNSAKATSAKGIEETAFNTNLEAAEEIARQLKLRDIGGLIVIDFIDMIAAQNQRSVANHLRNALKRDRARTRTGNITRFGLMEMSRQRVRPRLGEAIQVTCPRCDGQGTVRSIHSLALSIVRILDEEAATEKTAQLQAQLPLDLATYLLNEKHEAIAEIENRHDIKILIIPNQYLKTPKYKISRLRKSDLPRKDQRLDSHKLIEIPEVEVPVSGEGKKVRKAEEPAVNAMLAKKPMPQKKTLGLLKKLLGLFKTKVPEKKPPQKKPYNRNRRYYSGPRKQYSNRKPYAGKRPESGGSSNVRRGTRGGQNRPDSTTKKS